MLESLFYIVFHKSLYKFKRFFFLCSYMGLSFSMGWQDSSVTTVKIPSCISPPPFCHTILFRKEKKSSETACNPTIADRGSSPLLPCSYIVRLIFLSQTHSLWFCFLLQALIYISIDP